MRVFLDFKCNACGTVDEHFVDNDTKEAPCHGCSGVATKVQSPIRANLDPISGAFPGATLAWERRREQKEKQERAHSSFDPNA